MCSSDLRRIDATQIRDAITPRTKAIIAVHLHGGPADIQSLASFTRRSGIALIEDCAQALGTRVAGRPVGTFGDAGVFSR